MLYLLLLDNHLIFKQSFQRSTTKKTENYLLFAGGAPAKFSLEKTQIYNNIYKRKENIYAPKEGKVQTKELTIEKGDEYGTATKG